jgi:hypothetical protein
MVAANRTYLSPQGSIHAKPQSAEMPYRHHFDDQRPVSPEDLLFRARQHESDAGQPLTADDLRIHAWLVRRQAKLDRDRSGWRAKARRLFHW